MEGVTTSSQRKDKRLKWYLVVDSAFITFISYFLTFNSTSLRGWLKGQYGLFLRKSDARLNRTMATEQYGLASTVVKSKNCHLQQPSFRFTSWYLVTIKFMTDPNFLASVGSIIKELRLQKGMTQNELAIQCNFEKASMSRIESGKTNITLLTLRKISRALEVEVREFFLPNQMWKRKPMWKRTPMWKCGNVKMWKWNSVSYRNSVFRISPLFCNDI